jgi:cell wall-associated NlpC family hydrolase
MMANTYAVSVGVADVRRDPDPTSELVTQALLNSPVLAGETSGEWTRITLSDYEGWIRSAELEEPPVKGFTRIGESCATPLNLVAVVTETHTPLYRSLDGDEVIETAYLSTILPLLDTTQPQRVHVSLPGDQVGWISRDAVSIRQGEQAYSRANVDVVTNYARSFEGVPYLWGGTCWRGIDCSGFVQLCYRMGGYLLPRDADQQHDALPQSVARDAMREGDLIFFGSKQITHVAMALSNTAYIHAEGQRYNRVIIHSFNPASENYNQRLSEIVWTIKRVIS